MRVWGVCVSCVAAACAPWVVAACGSSHGGSDSTDGSAASADGTSSGGTRDGGSSTDGTSAGDIGASTEGDAGDAGLDAAPVPLGSLCALFTHDLCIYLMQCNQAPYRDLAHCEAELDCYGLPQLQAAAAEGGVIYDPAKVGVCNARFQANPCGFGFFLFTPDIFKVLAYCPGTITPRLEAGAPCVSAECVPGLYCEKDAGRCPGTCNPYATVGASCAGSVQCDPSLQCTSGFGTSSEVCEFPAEAGSPCTSGCGSTENCPADPQNCPVQNLWCDSTSHTCKPGVGEGAPCGPQPDGGPTGACASNLFCDQVFLDKPGICRKASDAGGPCNQIGCSAGLHCAGYVSLGADAGLGRCVGPSADGGPCNSPSDCVGGAYCGNGACGGGLAFGATCSQDTDCQSGLTCASRTCAHAAYPGDPCDGTSTVCVLSLCKNGTCVDHAKVGQPCTMNTDCATGTCYQGTCADTSVCPVP
jgi:hypothetical protein